MDDKKQFSPLKRQDKLGEGMLRTKDGTYVKMNFSYAISRGNTRFNFESLDNQDRLEQGLVKVTYSEFVDEKYVHRERYFSTDEIKTMKNGRIEEPAGCFVATVVYGNPEAPQVQVLREFRDTVLMEHPIGRRFVDFYYSGAGQRTADFITEYVPSTIPIIRRGLDTLAEKHSQRK